MQGRGWMQGSSCSTGAPAHRTRTADALERGLAGAQADLLLRDGHAGLVVAPLVAAHQRQQLAQLEALARVERLLLRAALLGMACSAGRSAARCRLQHLGGEQIR